ncbi:MAG: hypothetical protein AAF747_10065, partial [Planctomycetota bacterium]
MSPRSRRALLCVVAVIASIALPATRVAAQGTAADEALAAYLDELGLRDLLADHLFRMTEQAAPSEREAIAERLASIHSVMLDEATTAQEREAVTEQSQALLDLIPRSDASELRLNIAKATYLRIEEILDRWRLRIDSEDARNEAERGLEQLTGDLRRIGAAIDSRVRKLERQEASRSTVMGADLRADLTEARRLRSITKYYSGWAHLGLAEVTGVERRAVQALHDFGWLLNSPGDREPVLDRLPADLLQYNHVARAAVGVALANSVLDNDVTARRWLDAVAEAADTPPAVLGAVPTWRIIVAGRARRWADLQQLVIERRAEMAEQGETDGLLRPLEARMLAVIALDAITDGNDSASSERNAVLERIAQLGLRDLVEAGELGHVLDIVRVYGTAPVGDAGFVVRYVRAARAYEDARELHTETGDADQPTDIGELAIQYRDAADLFEAAVASDDAAGFPKEHARSLLLAGLSRYYARDFEAAVPVFMRAAALDDPDTTEDALWFAVVSAEAGIEAGIGSLEAARDAVVGLFLERFPAGERSAVLILRRLDSAGLSDTDALDMLLAIDASSALYEAARRRAASLLYRLYRSSPANARDTYATQFLMIAVDLAEADREALAIGLRQSIDDAATDEIATRLLATSRQALDVGLSEAIPDVRRAATFVEIAKEALRVLGEPDDDLAAEIQFREFQIALSSGDADTAQVVLDSLRARGGQFADVAERTLYVRAREAWRDAGNVSDARRVVEHGERVADRLRASEGRS